MRKFISWTIIVVLALLVLANSANILVIDRPRRSDVIVILAGETDKRPEGGISLLRKGFANRLILDVPADAKLFGWNELDLARHYIEGLPDAAQMTVYPIHGLSTRDEAQDVSQCVRAVAPKHILLVTSDYHTRRTLSTFQRLVPGYEFDIAAVYNPQQFGQQWWRHREWAKTVLYEWIRLGWWELVDRWRQPR